MEMQVIGTGTRAFEGLGSGAMKLYMPSSLCNYGPNLTTTNYAVQNVNAGGGSTNVTIEYFDKNGTKTGDETKAIGPGAKASFLTCNQNSDGFTGSAVITRTAEPIVAMCKAVGTGLFTAYVGFGSASNNVALPYVRWATQSDFYYNGGQRTYIAIQNIGSSTIPAGTIQVQYIDRNGAILATHTISTALDAGSKANSNANLAGLSEFGYYHPGYGGSVKITGPGGSQLAAIARVQGWNPNVWQAVAEDYNGMDIP
jgi:hypothetical protein